MIQVTGSFGTKSYDNTIVPVKELIDTFKLSDTKLKDYIGAKSVSFRYVEEKMMPDRDNAGMLRIPASYAHLASITLTTDRGDEVSLRYYKSKVKNGQDERYTPKRIELFRESAYKHFTMSENREQIFMLMISPYCQESPFPNPNITPIYRIYDPKKLADDESAAEDRIIELTMQLVEQAKNNPSIFIRTAKGLKVKGEIIAADFENINDVRNKVMGLMRRHPQEFDDNWNDTLTQWRGIVQDAFDLQILKDTRQSSDTVVEFNGAPFCKFSALTDRVLGVLQYMRSDELRIKPMLENAINEKTLLSRGAPQKAVKDLMGEEKRPQGRPKQ